VDYVLWYWVLAFYTQIQYTIFSLTHSAGNNIWDWNRSFGSERKAQMQGYFADISIAIEKMKWVLMNQEWESR